MDSLRLADHDRRYCSRGIRRARQGDLFKEVAPFGFEQAYYPMCGRREIAVTPGYETERSSHGGGVDHQSIELATQSKGMKISGGGEAEQSRVGYQFGQSRDRVGFDLDGGRRQAVGFENVVDPLTHGDGTSRQHPLGRYEILNSEPLAAKWVIFRCDDDNFVNAKRFVSEFLLVRLKYRSNRQVKRPVAQSCPDHATHSDLNFHRQSWRVGNDCPAYLWKQVFTHRRTTADADMTGRAGREIGDLSQRFLHRLAHSPCTGEKDFTYPRKRDSASGPLEQIGSHHLFKALDAFRQRRLCSA
jgi:hypothetical protein